MRDGARAEQPLLRALSVSMLLHILIVWPAVPPRPQLQLAQPLVARLTAVVSLAPVLDPTGQQPTQADTRAGAERMVAQGVGRTVRAVTGALGPLVPPRSTRHSRDRATPSGAPSVTPLQTDLNEAEPSPVASLQTGQALTAANDFAASGIDREAVTAYRFALKHAATRRKHYPEYARERGWSGEATLRITVAENGRPREVALLKSSGYGLLDREAKLLIESAAKRAAVPDSLRGREFPVELGVVFGLKDEAVRQ